MSLLTVGLGVLPGEAAAAGVDFTTRAGELPPPTARCRTSAESRS